MTFRVRTYNRISPQGLGRFPVGRFEVASELDAPDAYLLRSQVLDADATPDSVLAVARAGAGVNNVPVDAYSRRGIVVFNTPGGNANAVKELVVAGLLLGSRGIVEGIEFVRGLRSLEGAAMHERLEAEKKRFAGRELTGRTLGIVGLGAIGSMVADVALALGMKVLGYDPALSVEAAWRLPSSVERMEELGALVAGADYITLHVPAIDATRGLINADLLTRARPGTVLLNFARPAVVDAAAVGEALTAGRLGRYICDFPEPGLMDRDDVIAVPHLGASTAEAEDNCAIMAADQLMDFLINGNIINSVNFPRMTVARVEGARITIANENVAGVLGDVLSILAEDKVNIIDMVNRSRGDLAYNIIDVDHAPPAAVLERVRAAEHVISVRSIA
ncbi:MAG: phosphoglycerate dehydrogenase [Pseudomonadota bacterium]